VALRAPSEQIKNCISCKSREAVVVPVVTSGLVQTWDSPADLVRRWEGGLLCFLLMDTF